MDMLPAISLICQASPVETLALSSPASAGWIPRPGNSGYYEPISSAQLAPLGALRQLRRLTLTDVSDLDSSLVSTLRHLRALTNLHLALHRCSKSGSNSCDVFEAVTAMPQLEERYVAGNSGSRGEGMPDAMSRLIRLRNIHIRDVRIVDTGDALTTLTALQSLTIVRPYEGFSPGPRPLTFLPAGMHALRSLRRMWVTCYHMAVTPLALPGLEELQLDAPRFGGEVGHA